MTYLFQVALALLLSSLVTAYDCALDNIGPNGPTPSSCPKSDFEASDDQSVNIYGYSICMLEQYSFSALIQCVSQPNHPVLDGPDGPLSPVKVLTSVLDPRANPRCNSCSLASLILDTAATVETNYLADKLCDQLGDPLADDSAICCLGNCLNKPDRAREHSLRQFCNQNRRDLMNAREITCGRDDPDSDAYDGDTDPNAQASGNGGSNARADNGSDRDTSSTSTANGASNNGSSNDSDDETDSPAATSSEPTSSSPQASTPTTEPDSNEEASSTPAPQSSSDTSGASAPSTSHSYHILPVGSALLALLIPF
ncbi:MAG: hypothetical protein Q9174_006577 [Haloplaca sp. 1 TL-2023]